MTFSIKRRKITKKSNWQSFKRFHRVCQDLARLSLTTYDANHELFTNVLGKCFRKKIPCVIKWNPNDNSTQPFNELRNSGNASLKENLRSVVKKLTKGHMDVSISQSKEFSGHYAKHQTINMSIDEFVDYNGALHLYLAQFPLFNLITLDDVRFGTSTQGNTHVREMRTLNQAHLAKLREHVKLPPFIEEITAGRIESVNLWWSKRPTLSSLHFDGYDNFLCILQGTKVVELAPQDLYNAQGGTITNDFFNQATTTQYPRRTRKNRIRLVLKEGDILYLPKGWWHLIESQGTSDIIALNIWWNSEKCHGFVNPGMQIKYLMKDLVENRKKKMLIQKKQQAILTLPRYLAKVALSGNVRTIADVIMRDYLNQKSERIDLFFLLVLSSSSGRYLRDIMKCLVDRIVLSNLFQVMSDLTIELFTRTLEEIDKKSIWIDRTRHLVINEEIANQQRDEFYAEFGAKIFTPDTIQLLMSRRESLNRRILQDIAQRIVGTSDII